MPHQIARVLIERDGSRTLILRGRFIRFLSVVPSILDDREFAVTSDHNKNFHQLRVRTSIDESRGPIQRDDGSLRSKDRHMMQRPIRVNLSVAVVHKTRHDIDMPPRWNPDLGLCAVRPWVTRVHHGTHYKRWTEVVLSRVAIHDIPSREVPVHWLYKRLIETGLVSHCRIDVGDQLVAQLQVFTHDCFALGAIPPWFFGHPAADAGVKSQEG